MTLILTFFFRHLRSVIDNGHLYLAQPPLYKIQIGKKKWYAYNDQDKEVILKENAKGDQKANIQRYKGLGEMNPDQLYNTTMDPAQRFMKQITIDDAEEADQIFSILMGDEVPPRRKFIQSHAHDAELDI